MQDGIVKYDRWEELLWVYNGIGSQIRTPLTGALVGINLEDHTIKYNHWGFQTQSTYEPNDRINYNEYCGCYMSAINAIHPYETGLIVATPNGVDILNKDGGRRMSLISETAKMQIDNYGNNHIVSALLSCTANNPNIWLATNANDLYSVDTFVGQVNGTFKPMNKHVPTAGFKDKVTVLSDIYGNASRSSCVLSYCQQYSSDEDAFNNTYSTDTCHGSESFNTTTSSMESIAKKFGSVEAIPEFVPSAARNSQSMGTFIKQKMTDDITPGALSLRYALQTQSDNHPGNENSTDTICVGMLSGLLHVLDTRMQKIAHTIEAHNSAVGNVAACGNYIVTTGCYLYGNVLMHEPMMEVHDIRMKRTTSLWIGVPIRSTAFVTDSYNVVALHDNGGFTECNIATMEHTKYPNMSNRDSWIHHDIDVAVSRDRELYRVCTANEAYAVNSIELKRDAIANKEMDPKNLKTIFQKVQPGKKTYTNNTQFASLIGTYNGDVVQVFVQVFFFLEKLTSVRYHSCEVEHCLTCQVGFAMHMLHVEHGNRKGGIKEAENKFITTKQPELRATQLQELMPVDRSETNALSIQRLLLWIIEKMSSELDNYHGRSENAQTDDTTQLIKSAFGFSKTVDAICQNDHRTTKVLENQFCLSYTHLSEQKGYEEEMISYCTDCAKPVMTKYNIKFQDAPNFMIVNCDFDDGGRITRADEHVTFMTETYTLVTIVFSVPSEDTNYRLLAYVRVPQRMKSKQEWLLINDGYICELDNEDYRQILDFSSPWKQPITLIYQKDNMGVIHEITPSAAGDVSVVNVNGRIVPLPVPNEKEPIPASIFISESNIAHNPLAHGKNRTFVPLSVNELLALHHKQFIVALDVEGVKIGSETAVNTRYHQLPDAISSPRSIEMQKKTFIYSAKDTEEQNVATLARVSAVRGTGEGFGIPFLDHYIHRREPPKDYLTRFSGIHQGDLDLKSSVHWLTTRKAIYMKIRYLIDAGCTILGHGLEQDFKMLNIVVPQSQVIDTVELFRLPGRRYISLQFLAAHILNRRIQRGEHDSVEDAKAALYLYR
ncbi:PAB-dependent poly(A)-specific ribonuclease subunit PAN2 [Babesia sp. Xinjiang]|uniref:PAB-dependent poly(A)-specific ribonuclease subunit PAN2 n=1 Tax=Babesia sp. Xinjiang TaxID=462227 RepID=UPI000A24FBD8|nr:PAB-dependent poly(A)-specific ribonuclease subunit PAN2 [Babesia sp. Xinjiang]ORM40056.1 PAB-dependent poly(A)-specific ribonuclease subunit PAN2 [Babesia sp. Xinjiang]